MMDELCGFGSGPIVARSELGGVCGRRSRRGRYQGYVETQEGEFGLVYAKVSVAAGETGEKHAAVAVAAAASAAERLGSYLLLPVVVGAWAAGDKDPIAAAGIVGAQMVRVPALPGQRHVHAADL